MKGGAVIHIDGIDIGASIQQERDALMVAIPRCGMERSAVIQINSMDIGASLEEELDASEMTVP